MDINIFKQKWSETISKNKQLFYLNIALIIICFFLTIKILITKERIILVPPKLSSNLVIKSNNANKDYYIQMGLFLTAIVGNQTPKNSSFLMNILIKYFDPNAYQKLREKILDQVTMIQDRNISMVFTPLKVYTDEKQHKVFVQGIQKYKTGKHTQKEVKITYEIKFKISDYKIYVNDFVSHVGSFTNIVKGKEHKVKKPKKHNK